MIAPQLNDYWTNRHLTELRYAGGCMSGAGVPLNVIAPAFLDLDLTWFCRVYGNYDDNLLLLALEKERARSLSGGAPVPRVVEARNFRDEYELSEDLRHAVGLSFDGNSYSIEREGDLVYQIYIHDNCFFFVKPTDAPRLRRIVGNVLAQHAFYLGQEVDWSGVTDTIHAALTGRGKIELRSDRRKHCLWIPQLEDRWGLWATWGRGTILIQNGKARLRDDRIHGDFPPGSA